MCPEYYRRGRNWFTAMGVLFIISAAIVLIRQIILWTPDFAVEFLLNSDITNEKVSVAMIIFGCILLVLGFRKKDGRPR